jgi:hypothetical protein
MKVGTARKYRETLNSLRGEEMKCLVENFAGSPDDPHSHPLSTLTIAAKRLYQQKGVRKSYVLKQLSEHPRYRLWKKLVESGLVSSNYTPDEYLDIVEKGLHK